MFRRDSIEKSSVDKTPTVSDDSLPGSAAPQKPLRRGSFGPQGDARPPRKATRRASIGEETTQIDPSISAVRVADRISARERTGPRNDSFILMTEPPRRVSRRSSMGPGIETPAAGAAPKDLLGSSHSVASVNSESDSPPKKMTSLIKGAFSNPFRRKERGNGDKQRSSSWTQQVPDHEQLPNTRIYQRDAESSSMQLPSTSLPASPRKQDPGYWRPSQDDIMEDEELCPVSPAPARPEQLRKVRFAPNPEIHEIRFTGEDGESGEENSFSLEELKSQLWWNSEEMAQIRQDCMELVKDFLDDTEYMEAITKLFTAYKKSVTEEDVEKALEKVSQRRVVRGLEMHIVPRGGLLCEKHRRIVLTNVASTTVDGLSNTGEGWVLIRKESMKASRPCRQYAQKMAEHDAMEAIEATISSWSVEDDDGVPAAARKGEDVEEDDEDDDYQGPLNTPKSTPFYPIDKDVAPMVPRKRVSEACDEEDTGQLAGEGSSQEIKS